MLNVLKYKEVSTMVIVEMIAIAYHSDLGAVHLLAVYSMHRCK
jgi:hypothetical protein